MTTREEKETKLIRQLNAAYMELGVQLAKTGKVDEAFTKLGLSEEMLAELQKFGPEQISSLLANQTQTLFNVVFDDNLITDLLMEQSASEDSEIFISFMSSAAHLREVAECPIRSFIKIVLQQISNMAVTSALTAYRFNTTKADVDRIAMLTLTNLPKVAIDGETQLTPRFNLKQIRACGKTGGIPVGLLIVA